MNHTELVNKLKTLVNEERRITAEILSYLGEVESRKIFAHMGYPSLFEFCTKVLGYSEGAAQRRISAMRLIKEIPQVEEKIISGALSLSVVSQAQTFFKKKKSLNKPMATGEKLNLLSSLENSSTRECEKTLLQLEPELATKDRERFITPETLEIKITVDREFIEHLEALKNQLSHQLPTATTKDILAFALKATVAKSKPNKGPVSLKKKATTAQAELKKPIAESPIMMELTPASTPAPTKQKNPPPAPAVEIQSATAVVSPSVAAQPLAADNHQIATTQSKSRYISIYAKRAVWQRAEGKCQYSDPSSGRRCESRRFLEIDHIVPRAHKGSDHLENLQLLCDTHNRLKGARLMP